MRRKNHVVAFVVAVCLLVWVGVAGAQVKASGTLKCGKPDVEHTVEVGPNHVLVLDQSKCLADKDKPFEIGGVKSANAVSSDFSDVQGNKSKFHGYYSDTMENGDKGEYRFQGTATMKDGAIQTAEDSWTLLRGTGKLKGAKGNGTCKGTGAADGSLTWECDGEYTLASK
jgi:hypothetical protein